MLWKIHLISVSSSLSVRASSLYWQSHTNILYSTKKITKKICIYSCNNYFKSSFGSSFDKSIAPCLVMSDHHRWMWAKQKWHICSQVEGLYYRTCPWLWLHVHSYLFLMCAVFLHLSPFFSPAMKSFEFSLNNSTF